MSTDTSQPTRAPGDDAPDPTHFSPSLRPARVHLQDASEPTLVADAQIVDAGWVRVQTWAGNAQYYPPQRVRTFERLAVETYMPAGEPVTHGVARLADEAVRKRALQLSEESTTDAGDEAVVADD